MTQVAPTRSGGIGCANDAGHERQRTLELVCHEGSTTYSNEEAYEHVSLPQIAPNINREDCTFTG
eukprot:3631854-Amphidinium_carterae.2